MPRHSGLEAKNSYLNRLRRFSIKKQGRQASPEPSTPLSNPSDHPTSRSPSDQPPQSVMPHATHQKHHATLPTIEASPAPNYSPWNSPLSPTQFQLRGDFRSFTDKQNACRIHRGETPFCSHEGRDKAFEKMMRLSRGEEPIHWQIDSRPDRYGTVDADADVDWAWAGEQEWHEAFMRGDVWGKKSEDEEKFKHGEDESDTDTEMVDASESSSNYEEKDRGWRKRKDSAQAPHVATGHGGWKKLVGRVSRGHSWVGEREDRR